MNQARTIALAGLLSILATTTAAWPQVPSAVPATSNPAQTHFERGKSLMQSGDYAAACAAFRKSEVPEPTMSTQYHLGRCHEKLGHTATAKQYFLNADRIAQKRGDNARAKVAQKRARELSAKVPKLRIVVAKAQEKSGDLTVSKNGQPVPSANWNKAIEANPGDYVVVFATADGPSHTLKIRLPASAQTIDASLPAPTPKTQLPMKDAPAGDDVERVRRNPTLWWTGVGLTVGGGVALLAGSLIAADTCEYCTLPGEATASFLIGLAMAGTGVPLMLIFGKKVPKETPSSTPSASVQPIIGPRSAAVRVRF